MEQTNNQGVLPASVEVAVLLGEEGRSNSQEARPALEEGEFDDMKSFCVLYGVMCRDDVQLWIQKRHRRPAESFVRIIVTQHTGLDNNRAF